jgi:hypothetical protein
MATLLSTPLGTQLLARWIDETMLSDVTWYLFQEQLPHQRYINPQVLPLRLLANESPIN